MIVAFGWQNYTSDLLILLNELVQFKAKLFMYLGKLSVISLNSQQIPYFSFSNIFLDFIHPSLCQAFLESGFIPPFPGVRNHPVYNKLGILAGALPSPAYLSF